MDNGADCGDGDASGDGEGVTIGVEIGDGVGWIGRGDGVGDGRGVGVTERVGTVAGDTDTVGVTECGDGAIFCGGDTDAATDGVTDGDTDFFVDAFFCFGVTDGDTVFCVTPYVSPTDPKSGAPPDPYCANSKMPNATMPAVTPNSSDDFWIIRVL